MLNCWHCVVLLSLYLYEVNSGTPAWPTTDPTNSKGWVSYDPMTDEFDGTALNTSKWGPMGWLGRQPGAFEMHNIKVVNGELQLWARHEVITDPHLKKLGYGNYTTSAMLSHAQTTYGYFEIKAKPGNSTISSSFWFDTQGGPKDGWSLELDVVEACGRMGTQWSHNVPSHVHLWATPYAPHPNDPIVEQKCHCQPDHQPNSPCTVGTTTKTNSVLSDDFHIYGLEWNKTMLTIYFDGQPIWTRQNYCSVAPVALIFDRETMPNWFGLPPFNVLPDDPFRVEYVRAWKGPGDDLVTEWRESGVEWGHSRRV